MFQPPEWRIGSGQGFLGIEFSEPITNEEFSIKFTDINDNVYSMQLEGGRNQFIFDNLDFVVAELSDDIIKSISLMYRLTDVPKDVYLISTELSCVDGSESDSLPIPRFDTDAIVTEL